MRVRTQHSGRGLPFERERRLVLRRLPAGAVISRAVLTVAPYSVDPGRRFLETIAFPGAVGDWDANKSLSTSAVEVDLHARRKLAALAGSNLDGGTLLVDLGGGFLPVDANGGLGSTPPFLEVDNTMDLPALTVTGLRVVASGGPDVTSLRVASPPSNLTVAVEGGPVFFTHFGDLVAPVTTPDFSGVLTAMLPALTIDGTCLVPFVVHSDTIARLDLSLELDFTVAVDAMPSGLPSVNASYAYDGAAVAAASELSVQVPPGMVAVPGRSTGRAQGAFESSRVVYGPVTATAAEQVALTADGPLAHPFTLTTTVVASSVDLMLTAVTAQTRLAVDLVEDLDGKPGRRSLLSRPATLSLSRDQAGSPTWLNVALPEELELAGGVRRWLVLQARDGSADWGAVAADTSRPVLQRTHDGGLSWRAVPGGRDGLIRLRQTIATFALPLELRVGTGGTEVAVSLQRFEAQGAVDFDLSFDDVAHAVNTAVAATTATPPTAEHVANGDFVDWYRVGTRLGDVTELKVRTAQYLFGPPVAFSPDGAIAYAGARSGGDMRLVAFDVLCRMVEYDAVLGIGVPVSMAVDPAGRRGVIAGVDMPAAASGHALVLVDLADGRPVGVPVAPPDPTAEVAASPDGAGIYLLGAGDGTATVRFVTWDTLDAAAGGADLDWDAQPSDTLPDSPVALAVGSDGAIYVLTGTSSTYRVHAYADRSALGAGAATDQPAPTDARDLAVTPSGDHVLVLGPTDVTLLRSSDLGTIGTVPLGTGAGAQCLAVDPAGEVALIVEQDSVVELDLRRRKLLPDTATVGATAYGPGMAISPTGTHLAVTRPQATDVALVAIGAPLPSDWELTDGEVRPQCLPGNGEVMAQLGGATLSSREPAVPSSISQVMPATGDTRYRFSFDGIALAEGAVGQLIWRGGDCAVGRSDRVDVEVFDVERQATLARIPRHELVVTSPPGAVQVEVRFATTEGALIDHVSLAGSAELAVGTWQPQIPTTTVTPTGAGVTVTNGGAVDAYVAQPVALTAGQHFDLQVTARVTSAAAVELAFADETGTAVGTPARLPLDPLDFDDRALSGEVPAGAVEGELRIVVPPGGLVELTALGLTAATADAVDLRFVSAAPGELRLSGVSVQLDHGTPQRAPMPLSGLCPVSPGDGPDECYCGSCGQRRPVGRPVDAVTDSGRPASVSSCPQCGADRVRLGGRRPTGLTGRLALPRYRTPDRLGMTGPALVVATRVAVPLTDINGIGDPRAEDLKAAGIPDVVALARADVRTVAALPGVSSRRQAAALIAAAADLVRTHGERVIPSFL